VTVSTKRIAMVAGAATIVVVFIWYVALFRPESHHLSQVRAQHAQIEHQIASLQQQVSSLKALEVKVPADRAELSALNSSVPSTPDLTDVLNQLHSLATASGLEVTSVNPALQAGAATAPPAPGALQSIQLTMVATGTYQQLTGFLTALATMPRSVVVDSLSVSTANQAQLTASLNAQIFYATNG